MQIAVALVLIAACAVSYHKPLINGYFLADDYELLHIARDLDLTDLLTAAFYRSFPWKFIRPGGLLLWKTDYLLYGLQPGGYYITNLILHIGCTLLAAKTVRSLSDSTPAALIAGLLFAFHPSHPDASSYLAGRYDLLCTLLYLAGLNSYISFVNSGARRSAAYALSLIFFILAILSKEMALTLPLALALYELYYGGGLRNIRRTLMRSIPFAAVLAVYFVLRFLVFHGIGGYNNAAGGSSHLAVPSASMLLYNMWTYFRTMLLGINYQYPVDFSAYAYAISVSALISLVALYRTSHERKKTATFFALLIPVCLVPVVGISPVRPDLMGSRYVYLPSVFFAGIMGIGFSSWDCIKSSVRHVIAACTLIVIVCYYALLQYNNETWIAASAISKGIPGMFTEIYPEMPENANVTFYNLPQIIVGAPIFLDNSGAMEKALQVAYGYPEGRNINVRFALARPGKRIEIDTTPKAGFGRRIVFFYDNDKERIIKLYDSGPAGSPR